MPRHKTGRCHEKARNHRRCGAAAAIADPEFSGADYKAIIKMSAATPTTQPATRFSRHRRRPDCGGSGSGRRNCDEAVLGWAVGAAAPFVHLPLILGRPRSRASVGNLFPHRPLSPAKKRRAVRTELGRGTGTGVREVTAALLVCFVIVILLSRRCAPPRAPTTRPCSSCSRPAPTFTALSPSMPLPPQVNYVGCPGLLAVLEGRRGARERIVAN